MSRNLGIVSFRAGEFEKAIAPLARHLQANPQDVLIRKMLGSSYYLTKDFAKSVETLKPIEAEITSDAELAYFYGISLDSIKTKSRRQFRSLTNSQKFRRQTPKHFFTRLRDL